MSHRPRPLPWLIDTGVLSQTLPEWAVISPPLFRCRSRGRQECLLTDWGVLLLDVIMNIAVVIYSKHLSHWRPRGLLLFLKGILPKCVYVCANRSWYSLNYRRSEYKVFSLMNQIAFPNNVLASSTTDVAKVYENGSSPHGREGQGEQSSLAFKGTCTETACCEQSWFWQGKKGVVLHYHWEIVTNCNFSLRP